MLAGRSFGVVGGDRMQSDPEYKHAIVLVDMAHKHGGSAPDTLPINPDVPIDGVVDLRYPRETPPPDGWEDGDDTYWRHSIPFRDHRKDGQWFGRPDSDEWNRRQCGSGRTRRRASRTPRSNRVTGCGIVAKGGIRYTATYGTGRWTCCNGRPPSKRDVVSGLRWRERLHAALWALCNSWPSPAGRLVT